MNVGILMEGIKRILKREELKVYRKGGRKVEEEAKNRHDKMREKVKNEEERVIYKLKGKE